MLKVIKVGDNAPKYCLSAQRTLDGGQYKGWHRGVIEKIEFRKNGEPDFVERWRCELCNFVEWL